MNEETFKGQRALEKFIESLRADKRSEGTVREYFITARLMLRWIDKEPKDITTEDLEQYKVYMANVHGYATRTIMRNISIMKSYFKFLGMPIADRIKSPKRPRSLPKFLRESELTTLLLASQDDPMHHAIISVAYYGGLRASEIANLNISDINFEDNTIRVNNGKGGKDGIVMAHPDAIDAIKKYLPKRITPDDGSDALFITIARRRISRSTISYTVKGCAVKAKLNKNVTPHMLRHSLGATMRRHGASLLDIKDQLRHEDVNSTMIYAQIENEAVKKAYAKSVHSLERPKEALVEPQEPATSQQIPTNGDIDKLLDYKYLKGEISEARYAELKAKYSEHSTPQRTELPGYV